MIIDLIVSPSEIKKHITLVCFIEGCSGICDYCYNRDLWKISKRPLKTEVIIDKIHHLNRKYKLITAISFTGGEPLSRKDFPGFLKDFKSKLQDQDLYYNLDTSLTQGRISDVLKYFDKISISIKECWNNFPEVLENLKCLQGFNKDIELRCVLTKKNPEKLKDILYQYHTNLINLNVKTFRISMAVETEENKDKFIPLSITEFKEVYSEFKELIWKMFGEIDVIESTDF